MPRRVTAATLFLIASALAACEDEPLEPLVYIPPPAAPVGSVDLDIETGQGGRGGDGGTDATPTRPGPPAPPAGVAACCEALRRNGASAPAAQKPAYHQASQLCATMGQSPRVLAMVREALKSYPVPPLCQ